LEKELMIKVNGKDRIYAQNARRIVWWVVVEITQRARGTAKALIASGKTLRL